MTMACVAKQLHDISVGGYFNGGKFTCEELYSYIYNSFRNEEHLAIPHTLVMTIALPDGEWYFAVNHYNDQFDGFDYYIPETREQETDLIDRFVNPEV